MRVQAVSDLASEVANNPTLAAEIKQDPAKALQAIGTNQLPNTTVYRLVVCALGGAVLLGIIGSIVLAFVGKPIPDMLTALGSAAVGALAGLLAPSPASK